MIIIGQLFIAVLTIICPWLILSSAVTRDYGLQFFSVLVILFIILKKINQKKSLTYKEETSNWQLWRQSFEVSLVGMAILLLIGNTGGFGSWLLPLFFVYFFFHVFANHLMINILVVVLNLVYIYYFTTNFSEIHYGAVLSLIVFAPMAIFAQKYYAQAFKDNWQLELEREKVTYYNLYAERQKNELLKKKSDVGHNSNLCQEFIINLIPQIDNLQKESRFPQNQLVISAQLTKIGLALRQVLKKG